MTLINLCSHERLEIFPGLTVVVYSSHNLRASTIHLDGDVTIRQTECQPEEDQHGNDQAQ